MGSSDRLRQRILGACSLLTLLLACSVQISDLVSILGYSRFLCFLGNGILALYWIRIIDVMAIEVFLGWFRAQCVFFSVHDFSGSLSVRLGFWCGS